MLFVVSSFIFSFSSAPQKIECSRCSCMVFLFFFTLFYNFFLPWITQSGLESGICSHSKQWDNGSTVCHQFFCFPVHQQTKHFPDHCQRGSVCLGTMEGDGNGRHLFALLVVTGRQLLRVLWDSLRDQCPLFYPQPIPQTSILPV